MSNAIYPTLNQVLPCYLSVIKKLNVFLNCSSIDVEPNYSALRMNGKSEEICKGANLARKKMHKYYEQAMQMPLYCVATGKCALIFFFEFNYKFNTLQCWIPASSWTFSRKRDGQAASLSVRGILLSRHGKPCTNPTKPFQIAIAAQKLLLKNYGPISLAAK